MLANKELQDIVSALGCGIGEDFDPAKLRYGKIFLLMDADSDGHHICTLLLTFFYRHLRELIDGGHVYIAQPPLYRIDVGKETYWALDDAERDRILGAAPTASRRSVQRFKGLGEMNPPTLKETTLDPDAAHAAARRHRRRPRCRADHPDADGQGRRAALPVHHGARAEGRRARRLTARMASGLQHCSACRGEYVAGVAACVECGGPLQPGPLDRLAERARKGSGTGAAAEGAATVRPHRRLVELPGLQADHAVRAFLLEGITCGVECEGVTQVYAPGQPPAQPFAVTLPVIVYVTDAQYEAAQEICASSTRRPDRGSVERCISLEVEGGAVVEDDATAEPAVDAQPAVGDEDVPADPPSPESTSLRTVVLIVIAAIVLLFVFGR